MLALLKWIILKSVRIPGPHLKEALSVLMLCTPLFIFTSGSSALLGCPHCGLSTWLLLLAIFKTLFWVYANLFFSTRKWKKTWEYLKSTIFVYINGHRWLLGVQSINSERPLTFKSTSTFLLAVFFSTTKINMPGFFPSHLLKECQLTEICWLWTFFHSQITKFF